MHIGNARSRVVPVVACNRPGEEGEYEVVCGARNGKHGHFGAVRSLHPIRPRVAGTGRQTHNRIQRQRPPLFQSA